MPQDDRRRRFELLALPHLDAAYNLARWLAGNTTDAEDVVQDAYLRAYRYFDAFQGGNFRVWLLTIVRNAFVDLGEGEPLRADGVRARYAGGGDSADTEETMWGSRPRDPESLLLDSIDSQTLEPADGAAAGGVSRGAAAARGRGPRLQGDRRGDRCADRHGDVATVARAAGLRKLWLAQAETEAAHGV